MSDEDDADIARERQHWLNQLNSIPARRAQLDADERETVRQARLAGIMWEDIAEAIGHQDNITAEEKYGEITAEEKYGEPEPGESPF